MQKELDIGKGLIPFLHQRGKFRVEGVTKDDVRAYLDYLAVERGNSGVTRARRLAAVKSFFNYLVENDKLEANPAASIKSPRVPEREPVYLNEEECLRFLEIIAQRARPQVRERDMAIVVLLLNTGLRVSELTNLKLSHVDLERGQIKITRRGNKEQYLHLNGEAARVLVNYLHSRSQGQNGRLFVGTEGGQPEPHSCLRSSAEILKSGGYQQR